MKQRSRSQHILQSKGNSLKSFNAEEPTHTSAGPSMKPPPLQFKTENVSGSKPEGLGGQKGDKVIQLWNGEDDVDSQPKEVEDLDREEFHSIEGEDPENLQSKEKLGDRFYDIVDALFEIEMAEQERDVLYSEIGELPFGLQIKESMFMVDDIYSYLRGELSAAKKADYVPDEAHIDLICSAAVDIRNIASLENDLARAKDEQYQLTHNEYKGLINALDQLPVLLAKQEKKKYETQLAQIKVALAKAEDQKNEAYLEMGINTGMDLVGMLAFTNPWTAAAYGLGSWYLSTRVIDPGLGAELDGKTAMSSDLGDNKQLLDTIGSAGSDIPKYDPSKAAGGSSVSKYGAAGFGFNRINDGLEIKTAYENIDKLEDQQDDVKKKLAAQEKKIQYESRLSKIRAELRANKEFKDSKSLHLLINDTQDSLDIAYADFDKTYGEDLGTL